MAATKRVRVIYEYSYRVGDVGKQVCRGDECLVLCEYDENWLYVCKVDGGAHHMYVPRQFVQPAVSEHDAPATAGRVVPHDEDHPRYSTMSRLVSASDASATAGLAVSHDDDRPSNATVSNGVATHTDEVRRVTTRGSVISEASVDSDDNDQVFDDDSTDNDVVVCHRR